MKTVGEPLAQMPDLQKQKAEAFRAMHRGQRILMLPNAWDVSSARVIEEAGFGAIATTSAGIAFTLGYPDGQRISRNEMLQAVSRIAAAMRIPVTADVEAGYGDRPEDAAQTALAVIESGAVGMNLEDASGHASHPLVDLNSPLNILAGPGSPSVPELQQLGVARVSLGSSTMRATLGLLGRIAEELKTTGTYRSLENAPSHDDVNRMMPSQLTIKSS